ncbi:MAG TPA: cation:proton antiporter [Gemmataceae bacterium]|jgi:Kef-type K+ transport system membrane component KefB
MPLDIPAFLGLLVILLGTAKLLGALARWIGQPAVLGELLAGVVLGASMGGFIDPGNAADPRNEVLHVFAEIGVVLLLFTIGLETDLGKLLRVGGASTVVAVVGVALPFALGYAVCRLLGLANEKAVVAGAALTATSVGITARVLSDLGRLQEPEGQVILGAAVLDDIIGLVILTVVAAQTQGQPITFAGVARTTAVAFGFLLATLLLGRLLVPPLLRVSHRAARSDTFVLLAVMLTFALAWLAHVAGSAVIIGAFAAGLLLAGTAVAHDIERGVAHLAHFFVPLFFVMVGAAVDVRVFNPLVPNDRPILLMGGLLIVAAVVGKFLAGYAPFWFRGRKSVLGAGMIPRGEVGLIFAQMGLDSRVFNKAEFSAVTLMVMVTTFLAPPLLKLLSPRATPRRQQPDAERAAEQRRKS